MSLVSKNVDIDKLDDTMNKTKTHIIEQLK